MIVQATKSELRTLLETINNRHKLTAERGFPKGFGFDAHQDRATLLNIANVILTGGLVQEPESEPEESDDE